jgi:hypothetical protein
MVISRPHYAELVGFQAQGTSDKAGTSVPVVEHTVPARTERTHSKKGGVRGSRCLIIILACITGIFLSRPLPIVNQASHSETVGSVCKEDRQQLQVHCCKHIGTFKISSHKMLGDNISYSMEPSVVTCKVKLTTTICHCCKHIGTMSRETLSSNVLYSMEKSVA